MTAIVTISDGTVTVTPKISSITLSQSKQLAAAAPAGAAVTWKVDNVLGGNATVGVIDANGLYTAGTTAGPHTILATSVANAANSGIATVAVTDLTGVYTYHNDLARDGVNSREYALTTASVNTTNFGKTFSCPVDGAVYAQPLWVANLTVNGAKHNVVFVATAHDGLWAFDADASSCVGLWSVLPVNLIDTAHGAAAAGETSVPSGPAGTGNLVGGGVGDITPETGIISTPVFDPTTNTLYVVTKSVNAAQNTFYQRLHAIDPATGNEKTGSPVTIAGTFPGPGGTTIAFDPRFELQRCGLALVNGVVYIAWAGHEDFPPYYGWIMGYTYNGTKFGTPTVLNVAPALKQAGIWMSGGAIAADSNNMLYALTGNGDFEPTVNKDYGDSLLQLTANLAVNQYFTPTDQLADKTGDKDFGAGGATVLVDLPAGAAHPHLVMGGGKDGALYVIDRDTLGGLGDGAAVQKITMNPIFATGAFWNNTFYIAPAGSKLNAYALDTSSVLFTLGSSSTALYGWPGGTPSVSANGAQNGIVWILNTNQYCTSQSSGCGPAVLHAYDASNMATELWNSTMAAANVDAAGNAVKFAVPTVANGRVYVGTRGNNTGGVFGSTSSSGELDVYGLK